MSSRRPDLGAVLALAWLSFALLFTMVFGSMLGLRGWAWLGVHHLLCVVGCGHELRRASRRRGRRMDEATDRLRAAREVT